MTLDLVKSEDKTHYSWLCNKWVIIKLWSGLARDGENMMLHST